VIPSPSTMPKRRADTSNKTSSVAAAAASTRYDLHNSPVVSLELYVVGLEHGHVGVGLDSMVSYLTSCASLFPVRQL
jgi:hypothetical protein